MALIGLDPLDQSGEPSDEQIASARERLAAAMPPPEEGGPDLVEAPDDMPHRGFWDRVIHGVDPETGGRASFGTRVKELARSVPRGLANLYDAGEQTVLQAAAGAARYTGYGELLTPGYNQAYDELGARGFVADTGLITKEEIDTFYGAHSDDPVAAFSESMTQFMAGWVLTGPLKVAGGARTLAQMTREGFTLKAFAAASGRGALVDFAGFDPYEQAFAELAAQTSIPGLQDLGDLLSVDADDSFIEARLKRTTEGFITGAAVDALIGFARIARGRKLFEAGDEVRGTELIADGQQKIEDYVNGTQVTDDAVTSRPLPDGGAEVRANPDSPTGRRIQDPELEDAEGVLDLPEIDVKGLEAEEGEVIWFHSGDLHDDDLNFFASEGSQTIREQGGAPVERHAVRYENPLEVTTDATGQLNMQGLSERAARARLVERAQESGHDAVIIRNSASAGNADELITWQRSQVRSESDSALMREQLQGMWDYPQQAISSAETSINKAKVPAVFSKVGKLGDDFTWKEGSVNLDIGGGRFNTATEFLAERGVKNHIYDPFNRTRRENALAVKNAGRGRADTVTVSNVLNVIAEREAQLRVLQQAWDALKPGGRAYVTVYQGAADGLGKATKAGYQQNKYITHELYQDLAREVFGEGNFQIKGGKNGVLILERPAADEAVKEAMPKFRTDDRGEAEAYAASMSMAARQRDARNIGGKMTDAQADEVLELSNRVAEARNLDEAQQILEESHLNLSYYNEPREILSIIGSMSEVMRRELDAAQGKPVVPVKKIVKLAKRQLGLLTMEEAIEMVPAHMREATNGLAAWVLSADMVLTSMGRKIADMSSLLDARPHDIDLVDEARTAIRNLFQTMQAVAGSNSEIGRALRILQERGRLELDEVQFKDQTVNTGATKEVGVQRKSKAADDARPEGSQRDVDDLDAKQEPILKEQPDSPETLADAMTAREIRAVARMVKASDGRPRNFYAVAKGAQKVKQGGIGRIAAEVFVNFLLSGPKTLATVALSGATVSTFEPLVRATAGAATGNRQLMREGADLMWGNMMYMKDGILASAAAWRAGHSIMNPLRLRFAIGGSKHKAVNMLGEAVRLPGRNMMAADEFIRTVNYRSHVRAQSLKIAREQADRLVATGQLRRDEVGRWLAERVEDDLRAAYDSKTGVALYEPSMRYAELPTFSGVLDSRTFGSQMQRLQINRVEARFIIPFVKATAKLFDYAWKMTPGLNMLNREAREIMKRGGAEAATLHTRSVYAGMLYGFGVYQVMADNLTGRGPSDPELRKLWLRNHRPYSIRVGDNWVSYRRADPLAAPLGIIADLAQSVKEMDDGNEKDLWESSVAFVSALTHNLANKTYMSGLTQFAEAWGTGSAVMTEKWLERFLSSFMVPQAVNQLNWDDHYREVQGLLDAVMARVPGLSHTLPPRFDMFGDPVMKDPYALGNRSINPLTVSPAKEDPVADALLELEKAFGPLPKKDGPGGLIDLFDDRYRTREGKTAYERWNEIWRESGFREEIEDLVNDPSWKEMSAGVDLFPGGERWLRVAVIRSKHIARTRDQLRDEIMQLDSDWRNLQRASGQAIRDPDEAFRLLQEAGK